MVAPVGGPADQFVFEGGKQFGFVVQGGSEVEVAVMTGLFAERNVEIEAGHAVGED